MQTYNNAPRSYRYHIIILIVTVAACCEYIGNANARTLNRTHFVIPELSRFELIFDDQNANVRLAFDLDNSIKC